MAVVAQHLAAGGGGDAEVVVRWFSEPQALTGGAVPVALMTSGNMNAVRDAVGRLLTIAT